MNRGERFKMSRHQCEGPVRTDVDPSGESNPLFGSASRDTVGKRQGYPSGNTEGIRRRGEIHGRHREAGQHSDAVITRRLLSLLRLMPKCGRKQRFHAGKFREPGRLIHILRTRSVVAINLLESDDIGTCLRDQPRSALKVKPAKCATPVPDIELQ